MVCGGRNGDDAIASSPNGRGMNFIGAIRNEIEASRNYRDAFRGEANRFLTVHPIFCHCCTPGHVFSSSSVHACTVACATAAATYFKRSSREEAAVSRHLSHKFVPSGRVTTGLLASNKSLRFLRERHRAPSKQFIRNARTATDIDGIYFPVILSRRLVGLPITRSPAAREKEWKRAQVRDHETVRTKELVKVFLTPCHRARSSPNSLVVCP